MENATFQATKSLPSAETSERIYSLKWSLHAKKKANKLHINVQHPKPFQLNVVLRTDEFTMHRKLQRFVQTTICLLNGLTILNLTKLPVWMNNVYLQLFHVYLLLFLIMKRRQ